MMSEGDGGNGSQISPGGQPISPGTLSKSLEPRLLSAKAPEALGTGLCDVLRYMKDAFEDESVIDEVPLAAAGNPGAWHAWHAYRKPVKQSTSSPKPSGSPSPRRTLGHKSTKSQGSVASSQWNWDGVWEKRVKTGVSNSISSPVLYGGGSSDEMVKFPFHSYSCFTLLIAVSRYTF